MGLSSEVSQGLKKKIIQVQNDCQYRLFNIKNIVTFYAPKPDKNSCHKGA